MSAIDPAPGLESPQEHLSLKITDRAVLYAVYMPYLERGGLFVPTSRTYRLRDAVILAVYLPEEATPITVPGRVAWVTPPHAPGHKAQGVGVHFEACEEGVQLRRKIDGLLAGVAPPNPPSHTM